MAQERQSLNTTLEDRYNKQKVGGAFNGKLAGQDHVLPTPDTTLEDRYNKQSSLYVQGLDTRPYKP